MRHGPQDRVTTMFVEAIALLITAMQHAHATSMQKAWQVVRINCDDWKNSHALSQDKPLSFHISFQACDYKY